MAHRELIAVAIPVHSGRPAHPLLQERFTHPGTHLVRLSAGHGAPWSQRLRTLFHRLYRWFRNA